MIYAAILAGGIGKRMERQSIPKQFVEVGGIPVIIRTLTAFLDNDRFEKIYIAVHKDWKEYLSGLLAASFSNDETGKMVIVDGGKERIDSFTNVLDAIIDARGLHEEDILICHDSVRPFVRQQMINDTIDYTLQDGLALTVVPTADTIHVAHDEAFIDGTLDRAGLYNGQNPSGFNIALLHGALAGFTEDAKANVTGTTQLMLRLGHKIRIVKGHTSNFKITTDNDLDVADSMLRSRPKNRNITLLDCTLRDGGIVIDFAYGAERMESIKKTLEAFSVDLIECGYIDEKKGTADGERTCFDSEVSIEKTLLSTGKKQGISYVAMIDYGTFDTAKLKQRTPGGIDGIRLAFHKEHAGEFMRAGRQIREKGYDLYIQPMVAMRYTDEEYRDLIRICNDQLSDAKAFYVVDSFGQMDNRDLQHRLEMADRYVAPDMSVGFHGHNNRQMAYSNGLTLIAFNAEHDMMIDASIMGMGKGAGNLCTELIEAALIAEGKGYNPTPLYESISEYFSGQIKKTPWGYSLDYYLSSLYACTPSYIKLFTADSRVTTDVLVQLLQTMPEEKKAACDRVFATDHLTAFFDRGQV